MLEINFIISISAPKPNKDNLIISFSAESKLLDDRFDNNDIDSLSRFTL